MIGDAAENVGQPGLRIDAAELCRFDQRIGEPSTVALFTIGLAGLGWVLVLHSLMAASFIHTSIIDTDECA